MLPRAVPRAEWGAGGDLQTADEGETRQSEEVRAAAAEKRRQATEEAARQAAEAKARAAAERAESQRKAAEARVKAAAEAAAKQAAKAPAPKVKPTKAATKAPAATRAVNLTALADELSAVAKKVQSEGPLGAGIVKTAGGQLDQLYKTYGFIRRHPNGRIFVRGLKMPGAAGVHYGASGRTELHHTTVTNAADYFRDVGGGRVPTKDRLRDALTLVHEELHGHSSGAGSPASYEGAAPA